MAIEQITDHADQAKARLSQQFIGKTKVEALVDALLAPIQDLETALWDLLTKRQLDTAEGQQLDDIGEIVGEQRNGRIDTDYRRFISARIAVNRSRGTIPELLSITESILDDGAIDTVFDNDGPATVVLRLGGTDVPDTTVLDILIYYLRQTVAAGVRIIIEWSSVDFGDAFYWDTGTWDDSEIWWHAVD